MDVIWRLGNAMMHVRSLLEAPVAFIYLYTLFFYDKIFLSAENPETVRFYSPYQQDHDINYTTVQEIKTSTARGQ